jgi:hypothetical protein
MRLQPLDLLTGSLNFILSSIPILDTSRSRPGARRLTTDRSPPPLDIAVRGRIDCRKPQRWLNLSRCTLIITQHVSSRLSWIEIILITLKWESYLNYTLFRTLDESYSTLTPGPCGARNRPMKHFFRPGLVNHSKRKQH